MLEIKHDMSYLYLTNNKLKQMGFTNTTVYKICFQGMYSDDTKIIIQELKDYLELKYKMYQYKKDNGIKFGEEELFYWSNYDSQRYFDVTLKDNNNIKHNEKISKEIEEYVKEKYKNTNLYVRFQYHNRIDWSKINDYIEYFELDFNNIPFEELAAISSRMFYVGSYYTEESMIKLANIEKQIMKYFQNKKIIYNNIKGTLRELPCGGYGVFKPRATKTYYPIKLKSIEKLELV